MAMPRPSQGQKRFRPRTVNFTARIFALAGMIAVAFCLVAARLFVLQILSHNFYSVLAANQRNLFQDLFPTRGAIYALDPKSPDGKFPVAVNKTLSTMYANDLDVKDPAAAAAQLASLTGDDVPTLIGKLSRKGAQYVPLKQKMTDDEVATAKALNIPGIGFAAQQYRFYPEKNSFGQVVGFVGEGADSQPVGKYGAEGYWNDELAGTPGAVSSGGAALGGIIGSAEQFVPAQDGDDLVLTIDRNIQYAVCQKLSDAVTKHQADVGSAIVLDPKTGAILAMCNTPDFDPNDISGVTDIGLFNNRSIFDAYEPGSIFKAVTMASAIDAGKIGPDTTYVDSGSVQIGPYAIRNADLKAHGLQTMTQVLDESLNTGAIFAMRQIGAKSFLQYVEAFGFGSPTGIDLDTESPGDIESLRKKGDIWSATASFGQGITTTPLQMAMAYAAFANGGKLMKPYVVAEVDHADGTVDKTEPTVVRQVITRRAASLIGSMLVNVVENGEGKKAGVPGYYVAGKTGTAQVADPNGGYQKDMTIGSFAGYAPVDDPAFVIIVEIVHPRDVQWAESSAAPLFGDIAKFLLQYMQIPPDRP
jgi:cell division protein FtsI/penicillin-binding protein 2